MTIPANAIAKLAALGLTQEQAVAIAEVMADVEAATMAGIEAGKEKARERWRKWKANQPANADKRLPTTANVGQTLTGADAPVEDKTSNSEIEPQEKKVSAKRARRLSEDEALPDEWREDASKEGLPPQLHDLEWRKMRNWSLSAPKGAKSNWRPAWRNWAQRAAADLPRAGPVVVPMKDSVANAARRRIEALQNAEQRETRAVDDLQSLAGFLPLNAERARG